MFNMCSLTVIMFLHTETSKHQVQWGNQGHIVKPRRFLPQWCTVVLILSSAIARILTFPPQCVPFYLVVTCSTQVHTSDPNLTTALFFKDVALSPKTYPLPYSQLCAYKPHNWRFVNWFQAKMKVHLLLNCKHWKREK